MSNKKYNILVVDDNSENIKVIGSILRKSNYQVGVGFNGVQALDLLRRNVEYDLILLDVNMPKMDGFETCVRIRQAKDIEDIPIIFITALNETDNIVKGFESGGQDYITKPFNAQELLVRVQTHLELRSVKQELEKEKKGLEERVNIRTIELKEAYEKLELLNDELKRSNIELENLDQIKVDFLRILSHEINTPLNGIVGFTNILRQENTNSELYEMLNYLEISANRLEKFAEVSLLITELRTNNIVNKVETNIVSLVENIVSEFNTEDGRIKVHSDNQEYNMFCDIKLITRAFNLLIDNSLKFSPSDSTILVNFTNVDNSLICKIKDKGHGFAENILNNPFRLFRMGMNHIDGSTGLSLALVKLIIDKHSAKIDLSNDESGGAVIKITFNLIKE